MRGGVAGVVGKHVVADETARDQLFGEIAQARVVVEIAHGDLRGALANARNDARRRQGRAAQGEEVRGRAGRRYGQHVRPDVGQPLLHRAQLVDVALTRTRRQWPRQRRLVDLAGGTNRQLIHDVQAWHHRGWHGIAESVHALVIVHGCGVATGADIADQDGIASTGLLHHDSRLSSAGEGSQVRLDLAELNSPTADFHLIVDAAGEVQSGLVHDDVVAGAIRTLPAEGWQRCVLLGVLLRIQVACESHAADDQLALGARWDGVALLVDDGEVPAVQRETDGYGLAGLQLDAGGHDGGLGGAVGVPHFALWGGQALDQLLRAGLAADDEQAHAVERLGGPQAGQRRNCGNSGDVAGNQPWAQVHAGAHQRTRSRHQAGTISPGQPHFLTGGVEGDG